jgi:hypothetical protein
MFYPHRESTPVIEGKVRIQRQAAMSDFDKLYALGVCQSDFELIFPNGPRACPDWGYAVACGPEVHEVVCRLFDAWHEINTAEKELATRALPN